MIVGNYLVDRCRACGKYVRINKWVFGSLHLCDPPQLHPMAQAQINLSREQSLLDAILGIPPRKENP